MTEELFRSDAYVKSCRATVVSAASDGIVLDRTVFYATGGGQPGDTGMLRWQGAECGIVDTVKGDSGDIVHVPAEGSPLPPPGTEVEAAIDWDRRYRHMRMHTAMHLLGSVLK